MAERKDKLSTDSYKGVRDFYPEDMFIENYIFGVWRKTAREFGYEEYSASVLEPTELYRSKSSQEIVNEQTYSFKDRGEREVTLRPEMTPTVARMVAGRKRELGFPLRWFSIPNLFRYEQPQRGRMREHWQLNVDIFGVDSLAAEIECIEMAHRIMLAFGAKESDFEIRLNDRRGILKALAKKGISAEGSRDLMRFIDKKDKLSPKELADAKKQFADTLGDKLELGLEESDDVKEVIRSLTERGVTNARFDSSLVRGFDYYTGIVFEIFDTNVANRRSLFGGGRYDDLLSLFGNEKLPAFGFGMGDVTMHDFLETHGLLPAYAPATSLYLCPTGDELFDFASELANTLRKKSVQTAVDYSSRKIADQIKTADKHKVPFIIVVGDDERKTGMYKVKDLATGTETVLNVEHIPALVLAEKRREA